MLAQDGAACLKNNMMLSIPLHNIINPSNKLLFLLLIFELMMVMMMMMMMMKMMMMKMMMMMMICDKYNR